jgi:hypothetical protein
MSGTLTDLTLEWPTGRAPWCEPLGISDVIDGRFRVLGLIGRGGMGTVLRVERISDGKCYALKYCHQEGAARKRFAREVRIMRRVRHPHVVPVMYTNLEHSPPYFLMPLAEGSLVGELDRLNGNEAEVLAIFGQICVGIQALHASGIIHRDIKPANVLRFSRGRYAVSDFGLAKLDTRDTTILTRTLAFYGTFAYSAPEQHLPAGTREADARTDICQLGKMLYHMLTGKSPVLIEASALARGLVHIVQRATSGTPEDRYQNLGEFLDALRYYQLSKDPSKNAREALENLVLQAEDLLKRCEYKSENLRSILGLLIQAGLLEQDAAIESFDRIPDDLLPILAGELAGEFLPLLKGYAQAIAARGTRFAFAYADSVARRMRIVFHATGNRAVQAVALRALVIAAVELNRFAAMDVFNHLLRSVHTVDLALPIAEMLRAEAARYQKVADQIPPDRLHFAVRVVQRDVLAGVAETSFSELEETHHNGTRGSADEETKRIIRR